MLTVVKILGHGMARVLGNQLVEWGTDILVRHYTDHSLGLREAVERAHEDAWKALGVALAGDRVIDRCRRLFVRGELRGFRAEVTAFLEGAPLPEDVEQFREACLAELHHFRRRPTAIDPHALAQVATDLARFGQPETVLEQAWDAARDAADHLEAAYPKLAALLRLPVPGAPPLLVTAFTYFLERAITANGPLAARLQAHGQAQLAASQEAAFAAVGKALARLGDRADEVLAQLDRIESAVDETRDAVHDLLDRVGRVMAGAGGGGPRLVVSADDSREQEFLCRVREEYRRAPPGRQTAAGWMLLGDSMAAAGLIVESADDHEQAARLAADAASQAEAWFKVFRAAAQMGDGARALNAYHAACALDPGRFTLLPGHLEPESVRGGGAFGTVFRCRHRYGGQGVPWVAVKALHAGELARSIDDVFREAQVLSTVHDPAIIHVRDWNFIAPQQRERPYILMDYFEGASLAEHLARHGPLSPANVLAVAREVARGMKVAHDHGVWHRDLKPDNLLVHEDGGRWRVKIVDFGLAVRPGAGAQALRHSASGAGSYQGLIGTWKYAPPEMRGAVGVDHCPASDVYSFGRTFCEALFGTTEPRSWHFARLPEDFAALGVLLEQCIAEPVSERPAGFDAVLANLAACGSSPQHVSLRPAGGAAAPAPTAAPAPQQQKANIVLTVPAPRGRFGRAGPGLPMEFAWVPPGSFLMGSPEQEPQRVADERLHKVRLTRGLWLAVRPVSVAQFRAFATASRHRTRAEVDGGALDPGGQMDLRRNWQAPGFAQDDHHPVTCVSWDDAAAFCAWLRKETGRPVRLPTEAEWEWACRAGEEGKPFAFAGALTPEAANYACQEAYPGGRRGEPRRGTTPAGAYPANAWGLFDMHGNVAEWCQDDYGDAEPPAETTDPLVRLASNRRVVRGGSWADPPRHCRSASRRWLIATCCRNDTGFRIAVDPN